MPEWLTGSTSGEMDVGVIAVAIRLLLASAGGLCVASIGDVAHGHRKADAEMFRSTLVLLTVLIAMVTLVIGNSVARAFGLVGALSIVRFRTVVDDTRDTAFVIFAVIVGMAIGAGVWWVPLAGIPLIGCLAVGLDRWGRAAPQEAAGYTLTIRIGLGRDAEELLRSTFDEYLASWSIISTGTTRQGAAVEIVFSAKFQASRTAMDLPRFVAGLNRIDGVQSVEIARL